MSEEKIKTLMQTSVDKLHDMFNLAWDCNKSDETRTRLSRMVTDYITHVNQDFSWLIGIAGEFTEAHLCAIAEAERDGRLVVLPPVKRGDYVWILRMFSGGHIKAVRGEVSELHLTSKGKIVIRVYGIGMGEWGVRVFATREAAEAALSAGKGE